MTDAIAVTGLTVRLDGVDVLEAIDLAVPSGEFLGLVGPNGGGKSVLIKTLLGLIPARSGRIQLLGGPPQRTRHRAGYVPQYAAFRRDFPISVREVVLTGRLGRTSSRLRYTRADHAVVQRCLADTEIEGLARRPLGALSGGELQRVLIARALACEPEIIFLDEPTANVDPRVERDLFQLLRDLNRRMTVVVVSHDLAFVTDYAQRVACLNRRLACHSTVPLSGDQLAELYGHPVRAIDHHSHA